MKVTSVLCFVAVAHAQLPETSTDADATAGQGANTTVTEEQAERCRREYVDPKDCAAWLAIRRRQKAREEQADRERDEADRRRDEADRERDEGERQADRERDEAERKRDEDRRRDEYGNQDEYPNQDEYGNQDEDRSSGSTEYWATPDEPGPNSTSKHPSEQERKEYWSTPDNMMSCCYKSSCELCEHPGDPCNKDWATCRDCGGVKMCKRTNASLAVPPAESLMSLAETAPVSEEQAELAARQKASSVPSTEKTGSASQGSNENINYNYLMSSGMGPPGGQSGGSPGGDFSKYMGGMGPSGGKSGGSPPGGPSQGGQGGGFMSQYADGFMGGGVGPKVGASATRPVSDKAPAVAATLLAESDRDAEGRQTNLLVLALSFVAFGWMGVVTFAQRRGRSAISDPLLQSEVVGARGPMYLA